MARHRGVPWLLLLGVLVHAGQGQRDFDLADALDDPEPTKKPGAGIYPQPKPPYQPQPGYPDNGGNVYPRPKPQPPRPQPGGQGQSGGFVSDIDHGDDRYPPRPRPPADVYPRPKPQPPRPQPGGHGDGGGYYNNIDHGDDRYPPRPRPPAGGGGHNPNYDSYGNTHGGEGTYSNPEGNTVARIVSPIVSVVIVTLVGAAASYFTRHRRGNCFHHNEPTDV